MALSGRQVLRKASVIRAGRVSAKVFWRTSENHRPSEGRHAGTSERLFESLPAGKSKNISISVPNGQSLAQQHKAFKFIDFPVYSWYNLKTYEKIRHSCYIYIVYNGRACFWLLDMDS